LAIFDDQIRGLADGADAKRPASVIFAELSGCNRTLLFAAGRCNWSIGQGFSYPVVSREDCWKTNQAAATGHRGGFV
jgi:hypothetical protein